MFDWFRRLFRESDDDERQRFFGMVDALNSQAGGGPPTVKQEFLGKLELHSSTLSLCDPQLSSSLEVPNIRASEAQISATLWRYPLGRQTVSALRLKLGDQAVDGGPRKIGELIIDSAKLIVADKADVDEHWTEVGPARIGVISTAPDETVRRLLTQRFKLKTARINAVRAEVATPVSPTLEKEILAYLKSIPKYASFPFMHFHVETKSSFDRANHFREAWGFVPVGNANTPRMFVCGTGRGDGVYDVHCGFAGDIPQEVSIDFLEDGSTD